MTKQMTRADYERLLLENENELWYCETKFKYTETLGNASKSVSIDTYMTNEELVALCRELFIATGEVDA